MELVLLLGALTAGLYVGSKGLMFAGRLTGKAIKGSYRLVKNIKTIKAPGFISGGADEINEKAANVVFAVKDSIKTNRARCSVIGEDVKSYAHSVNERAQISLRRESMKEISEPTTQIDPRLVHDVN